MKILCVCVLAIGCQSSEKAEPAPPPKSTITADDCHRFLVKARATIEAMGHVGGMQYSPAIEESAERDCRSDVAAGKPMVLARCVLDATSEDAVHACFPTYDQLVNKRPK